MCNLYMSSFNFKTTKWHTKIAETERIESTQRTLCTVDDLKKNDEKKNH